MHHVHLERTYRVVNWLHFSWNSFILGIITGNQAGDHIGHRAQKEGT